MTSIDVVNPDTSASPTAGDASPTAAVGGEEQVGGAFIRTQSLGTESAESAVAEYYSAGEGGGPPCLTPRESDADADVLVRNSWSLLAVLVAILDNVYGAPVDIEPIVDPSSEEGKRTIRRWVRLQRAFRGKTLGTHTEISQAPVDKACAWIDARLEYEIARAEGFCRTCGVDHDLQTLRHLAGFDLETRGRAEIEVLRGSDGAPRGLQWTSARYIKIEPKGEIVGFRDIIVHNPLTLISEARYRRFHGFYQVDAPTRSSVHSYFREFGDPRLRSRSTGKRYPDMQAMRVAETGAGGGARSASWKPGTPATEILHFVLPAPWAESTGLPLWYGAKPEALGIRELAQENRGLMSGQLIPLLMMLVSGGARIGPDQQEYWQRQFQAIKPGERGLVIMQVLGDQILRGGGKGSGEPKIQIENTRPAQQDDALGLKYTTECDRAIRRLYHMSRSALGDMDDVTRDTAELALRFAESQAYEPRRDRFNRPFDTLLRAMGLVAVRFRTRPRMPMHVGEVSEALQKLSDSSLVTPEDVRPFLRKLIPGLDSLGDKLWSKFPRRIVEMYGMSRAPQAIAPFLGIDEEHSPPPEITEQMRAAGDGALSPEDSTPYDPTQDDTSLLATDPAPAGDAAFVVPDDVLIPSDSSES